MEYSSLIGATFKPDVDSGFYEVAEELQRFAVDNTRAENAVVNFVFVSKVDIKVMVAVDTDLDLLQRDFERAVDGCIPPNIGPWPKQLTDTEKAHDKLVRSANVKLDRTLAFLPRAGSGWSERDGKSWKASRAIFWARLMQLEIINDNGRLRKDVVAATALETGYDNDPGGKAWAFDYLRYYWEFGPKLGAATRGWFRDMWTEFCDVLTTNYSVPVGTQAVPYRVGRDR